MNAERSLTQNFRVSFRRVTTAPWKKHNRAARKSVFLLGSVRRFILLMDVIKYWMTSWLTIGTGITITHFLQVWYISSQLFSTPLNLGCSSTLNIAENVCMRHRQQSDSQGPTFGFSCFRWPRKPFYWKYDRIFIFFVRPGSCCQHRRTAGKTSTGSSLCGTFQPFQQTRPGVTIKTQIPDILLPDDKHLSGHDRRFSTHVFHRHKYN